MELQSISKSSIATTLFNNFICYSDEGSLIRSVLHTQNKQIKPALLELLNVLPCKTVILKNFQIKFGISNSVKYWLYKIGLQLLPICMKWLLYLPYLCRNITLPTKVHLVKAMVFPVVMYGHESWTTKKVENWRIDAFELWCCRRFLRVSWTARRSNQSILKEISPEYSLEGLLLMLKLQYFVHLMWKTDSLEKTLMLERLKQEEKGSTEDAMVGWHQRLNGHEFE